MKVIVNVNNNNNSEKKIKEFKEFDLGEVDTTIEDLLADRYIQIDENEIPILKLTEGGEEKRFVINNLNNEDNTGNYQAEISEIDLIPIGGNGSASIAGYVPYNGAEDTLNMGGQKVRAQRIEVGNNDFEGVNLEVFDEESGLFHTDLSMKIATVYTADAIINYADGNILYDYGTEKIIIGLPSNFPAASGGLLSIEDGIVKIGDISGAHNRTLVTVDDSDGEVKIFATNGLVIRGHKILISQQGIYTTTGSATSQFNVTFADSMEGTNYTVNIEAGNSNSAVHHFIDNHDAFGFRINTLTPLTGSVIYRWTAIGDM